MAACSLGSPPPDQNGEPPNLPAASASPSTPSSIGDGDGSAEADVVASNIPQPWGIAFLPDGSALVTERKTGRILKIGQPATPNGLTTSTFAVVKGISATGDGGLLGIAVSPHFATDSSVFVYYSTTTDNRIVKVQAAAPPTVIVKGIPRGATDNGGALAFGPDGYLYASTGDAGRTSGGLKAPSQDSKSLAGKILRMTVTGKPAPSNPTPTSLIYARGFHNVEGLAWDQHKHLYVVDAGARADNVDVVKSGGNYGWPLMGTSHPLSGVPTPIQTWPLDQSTCSGAAIVDNAFATACPTGKRLWLVEITANASTFGAPASILANTYGRLRAVVAAPDGTLWISTTNTDGHGTAGPQDDQIIRVVLPGVGAGVT